MQTQELVLSDRELDELFYDNSSLRIDVDVPSSPANSSAPSSPALSPTEERIPLADGVVPPRCGYRTGKCQNLQAVKRNGKLHKLCEFHREKANQNQKKLDRKKRLMRYSPYESAQLSDDDETASSASSAKSYETSPRSIDMPHLHHQPHYDVFAPHPTNLMEAPQALAGEELAIFYNLMTFDASQFAAPSYARAPYHNQHGVPQFSVV